MRRETNMTNPISLLSTTITCPERVSLDNPGDVMAEIRKYNIIDL